MLVRLAIQTKTHPAYLGAIPDQNLLIFLNSPLLRTVILFQKLHGLDTDTLDQVNAIPNQVLWILSLIHI